jgi:D-tyrosyl-tRNA(Tyr) deacylase
MVMPEGSYQPAAQVSSATDPARSLVMQLDRRNNLRGSARDRWFDSSKSETSMRACVQRVSQARVTVAGEVRGEIARGVVVLLGVAADDSSDDARALADKITGLRIFDDEQGKMNLALADVGGAMLVVSQFTLLGDCRKGRRPAFTAAAQPELAERLYEQFVLEARQQNIPVETGRFAAMMQVHLINDGPVTLLLDSRRLF